MVQCNFTKQNGYQCTRDGSNKDGDDSKFCWQHQNIKSRLTKKSAVKSLKLEDLTVPIDDNYRLLRNTVKDIGIIVEQNKRPKMEDTYDVIGGLNITDAFFGIYDGHNGKGAALYAAKNFQSSFSSYVAMCSDVIKAFETAYTSIAFEIRQMECSGTTAVTAYIQIKDNKKTLFVANAGDSRAILCQNNGVVRLSYDHKASDPREQQRITDAGGPIVNNRVAGTLAVSRALGDNLLSYYVIPDPHISVRDLTNKDKYLILASDGLWDVITDEETWDFVMKSSQKSCQVIAKELFDFAVQRGSTDNITIIVVSL